MPNTIGHSTVHVRRQFRRQPDRRRNQEGNTSKQVGRTLGRYSKVSEKDGYTEAYSSFFNFHATFSFSGNGDRGGRSGQLPLQVRSRLFRLRQGSGKAGKVKIKVMTILLLLFALGISSFQMVCWASSNETILRIWEIHANKAIHSFTSLQAYWIWICRVEMKWERDWRWLRIRFVGVGWHCWSNFPGSSRC